MLHWSNDEWKTPIDTASQTTAIGINFVDVAIAPGDRAPLRFTFSGSTTIAGKDATMRSTCARNDAPREPHTLANTRFVGSYAIRRIENCAVSASIRASNLAADSAAK